MDKLPGPIDGYEARKYDVHRRRAFLGAAVLALVTVGCGEATPQQSTPEPVTHDLTVEVSYGSLAAGCLDLGGGTVVTVRDADGTIVGSVGLPAPESRPNPKPFETGILGDTISSASASLDVPDSGFYEVEVEGLANAVTFNASELAAEGWVARVVCG
jgi:hypothetical protein